MGKIKKILENELAGGTKNTDVYPVTAVKAVYDENNERLDHILARRGVVNVSTNYNDDHIAEVLTLSQAIAKVPSSDRVLGFTMTFLSSDGWKTYQFTGDSISNWSNTTKWDPVLHSSEVLQELGNSKTAPVSQMVVRDAVSKTTKDSRFKETIEVIVPSGTSNAHITIQKYTESEGKLYFTIDNSNFPSNIAYIGTQIRDDDNLEITTFSGVTKYALDSFESKYFSIGCYFASKVPMDVHIPIEVVYEQRYKTYDNAIDNKMGLCYVSMYGAYYNPIFNIDFNRKEVTTYNKEFILYDTNATLNGYHGLYIDLRAEKEKTIPFDIESYPDSKIPYWLIYDYTHKEFRVCNYAWMSKHKGEIVFYPVGYGAIQDVDVIDSFKINCDTSFKINGEVYYNGSKRVKSLDGLIPVGISTKRFENFQDFNIYGYGSSVSILKDSSGKYDTPPIEIAGGGISNITVIEDGGVTDHSAYCVHSDSNNAKGKTLRVDNCHFISNSGSCCGVGTRNGYTIEFRNCVFDGHADDENDLSGICWYSHNTVVDGNIPSLDDKSKVIFIGCTFISNKKYCMRLQDWIGDTTDYCEWTFINCTFICTSVNTDDAVYIEYKGYPDELGAKEFKHKFSLSEKSCGNNVSWLNYNNE